MFQGVSFFSSILCRLTSLCPFYSDLVLVVTDTNTRTRTRTRPEGKI
jgi:hypothetical protein